MGNIIDLDWKVGPSKVADAEPEEWVAATVPGAVQLDWAKAKGWEPYWKGDRFRDYSWMEDRYWIYEADFEAEALGTDEELAFVCGGVDYAFEVWFNGSPIWKQVGMHTPVDLVLTSVRKGLNCLRIVVLPAPKQHRKSVDHTQADRTCKPPVSYGWD